MSTDEVADGPAMDGIIDTFDGLFLSDGSETAFSMEELTGRQQDI